MSTTDVEKEIVWSEIVTRIEAVPDVQKCHEGFIPPDTIPDAGFPCGMLEPDEASIVEDEYWGVSSSWGLTNLNLLLWFFFRIYEKQKHITGTVSIPGIFDWEKTIKKALVAAPLNLNDKAIKVSFGTTLYLRSMTEQPDKGIIRGFELPLIIPVMEHLR